MTIHNVVGAVLLAAKIGSVQGLNAMQFYIGVPWWKMSCQVLSFRIQIELRLARLD
tara:strand:+ start:96 stop:263 length:168 start_codon:yes stop_codon:yes gene_type:complete